MAVFEFRLEKVWKHRRRVVDEHSLAVARADRRVASLSRQIVELDENIARHARTMVPRKGLTLRTRDLIDGATWLDHLYHLHEDLDSRLQTAVKDLERHRSRLTGSWRDLEVLSRLKERQEENWRVGQDQRERREMDEIGQIRAFRHGAAKDSR
jgi:flagellar export protein FliJ